ncbi:hypothetical protein [Alteribacillus sp. YIM 98480]|uniref:hypothetical protein n=1 Tax=Alteribacillus sp. YIM 98480 TaxID=2606599 RepID=UPI001E45021A|nr:hypothetical protein [Alteribacillus sp. YIM 98480]
MLKPRRPVATQKSTPPVQASSALSQDVTVLAERLISSLSTPGRRRPCAKAPEPVAADQGACTFLMKEVRRMGYVAPTKNEQAVNYGSRLVENEPSIRKIQPIQPATWQRISSQDTRNAYHLEEDMERMNKRREIEQKFYGKGRRFDANA